MTLLTWHDSFSTGIGALDGDHKRWIESINDFHKICYEGGKKEEIPARIDAVHQLATAHFAREEEFMRSNGYQGLDEHHKHHAAWLAKLVELRDRQRQTGNIDARGALEYLKSHFVNHVGSDDLRMREFFRAKGVADIGASAEGKSRGAGLLDRMRVRTRVVLMVLVPLLCILAFAGFAIYDRVNVVREMAVIDRLANVAAHAGAAVHEFQRGRGMSSLFHASEGKQYRDELAKIRSDADPKLAVFRRDLDDLAADPRFARLSNTIAEAKRQIATLPELRNKIDALAISVADLQAAYGGVIGSILAVIDSMALESSSAQIQRSIVAYSAFVKQKEHAGRERAIVSGGFTVGKFEPPVYERFARNLGQHDAYAAQFEATGAQSIRDFVKQTVAGATVDEVAALRKVALESLSTGNTGSVAAGRWFELATQRIDLMKRVEDRMGEGLVAQVMAVSQEASRELVSLAAMSGAIVLAVVALAVMMVFSITTPLANLNKTMKQLADGDHGVDIYEQARRDEIGDMAKSLQYFKENLIRSSITSSQGWIENTAQIEAMERKQRAIVGFEAKVGELITKLADQAESLTRMSDQLSGTAANTAKESDLVSNAARNASERVQSVASAAEELRSSISEIGRQIELTTAAARSAAEQAQDTDKKVTGLVDATSKIGEVVKLINEIASQTNLLALNATIEAARAGDAGRGFAVVADEVTKLANRSGQAALTIRRLVTAVRSSTDGAMQEMKTLGSVDMTETLQSKERVEAYTKMVIRKNVELEAGVREARSRAEELVGDISGIVTSLQFQDITRQKVEHVVAPLKKMQGHMAALAAGSGDAPTFADLRLVEQSYTMEEERAVLRAARNGNGQAVAVGAVDDNVTLF